MEKILEIIVKRWLSETPKVAKFLQYIAITLTAVTGLPSFINGILNQFDLQLISSFTIVSDKIVAIATAALAMLLQFTKKEEK